MKKRNNGKLNLSSETLRRMGSDELVRVAGGVPIVWTGQCSISPSCTGCPSQAILCNTAIICKA